MVNEWNWLNKGYTMEKQIEQFLEDLIINLENMSSKTIRQRALKLLRREPIEKRKLCGDGITTFVSEEVYKALAKKLLEDGKLKGIVYLRDSNPYVKIGVHALKEMVEQVMRDENIR